MTQRSKFALLVMALVLSVTAMSSAAMADPGKGKHKHHKHDVRQERVYHDYRAPIVIHSNERIIIRDYIARDYHSHCPPGIAKKHNGCMPPGQAKKYRIGGVLPDGIYIPVQGQLLTLLQPVPVGYQYVQVDRDVLLVSEATKRIVDAVTLLSAVGN